MMLNAINGQRWRGLAANGKTRQESRKVLSQAKGNPFDIEEPAASGKS